MILYLHLTLEARLTCACFVRCLYRFYYHRPLELTYMLTIYEYQHSSYIMKNKTYAERVLELASQKEIIRLRDLKEIDIPRVVLTGLIRSGLLEKIARG